MRILSAARVVLVSLAVTAGNSPAAAEDAVIELFGSSFLPQSAKVLTGDKVIWRWISGSHTIASGLADGEPGTLDEPGRLFESEVNEANPSFEFLFSEPRREAVPFFCRQHPRQIGSIEVSAGEEEFLVGVVDNVFIPEEIWMFAGDSIKWEHEPMEDFHTVTSGLSSKPEHDPGALFDEESSDEKPIFVYRFDDAGDYPYFCRPHEFMDMVGVIYVQETFVRGDATGNGILDISDAIASLSALFLNGVLPSCTDSLDADDDGQLNITDPIFVLTFLFLGGDAKIPRPFPFPGPDRTEDALLCAPAGGFPVPER